MVTRTGAGLLVGGVVAYGMGVGLGYPTLTGLGVAAVVLVLTSCVVVGVRPQLDIDRTLRPTRVPVGDRVQVLLRIRNRRGRPVPGLSAVDPVAGQHAQVLLPRIGAGESVDVTYELPALPRGVYEVGPLTLRRSDLFGLAAAVRDVGGVVHLWVHPRVHRLLALPATRTRSLEGLNVENAPRGTATFHAVREYTTGDDVRHIHWRSTARTGQLMVREYIDTSLPDLTLVIDNRIGALSADAFETGVEIVASVAVATIEGGFPLRLLSTVGATLTPPGSRSSLEEVLDELAGLTQQAPTSTPWLAVDEGGHRGQVAVAVTGALGEDELRDLAVVLSRFATATLVLVDGGGPGAPDVGAVRVIHCRTTAEFADDWNATT